MRSFAARILVLVLVLSQTWMGALRGLDLCIPLGQCEGCRDAAVEGGAHEHAHAHLHTHGHVDAHRHDAHQIAHHVSHEGGHVGDEGCICHIHVATPDDDTHRGAAPSAAPLIAADSVGTVEAFLLALATNEACDRPDLPPERDGRTPPERISIASTVLLV